MEMMAWWHSVLPGKVLDVAYEDMVEDTEGQVRGMVRVHYTVLILYS
jgi:hypothetical protein